MEIGLKQSETCDADCCGPKYWDPFQKDTDMELRLYSKPPNHGGGPGLRRRGARSGSSNQVARTAFGQQLDQRYVESLSCHRCTHTHSTTYVCMYICIRIHAHVMSVSFFIHGMYAISIYLCLRARCPAGGECLNENHSQPRQQCRRRKRRAMLTLHLCWVVAACQGRALTCDRCTYTRTRCLEPQAHARHDTHTPPRNRRWNDPGARTSRWAHPAQVSKNARRKDRMQGAGIRIDITDNHLDTPRRGHYCKFSAGRQAGLAHTRPPSVARRPRQAGALGWQCFMCVAGTLLRFGPVQDFRYWGCMSSAVSFAHPKLEALKCVCGCSKYSRCSRFGPLRLGGGSSPEQT